MDRAQPSAAPRVGVALWRTPTDKDTCRTARRWCWEQVHRCGPLGDALHRNVRDVCSPADLAPLREGAWILVLPGPVPDEVRKLAEAARCPVVEHVDQDEDSFVFGMGRRWIRTRDVGAGLRKALLHSRVGRYAQIRPIQEEREIREYLQLRFRIWDALGYIPAQRRSPDTALEVDYSDRTSIPIGAFRQDELIGCARLVLPIGRGYLTRPEALDRVVEQTEDARLQENLRYPAKLLHPFDILESFPGFRPHYKALRKSRRSVAEVGRVIVSEEAGHRNRGIGEVLVDCVVSLAAELEVETLLLACLRQHERLYARSGFAHLDGLTCESFASVRVPAIAMARDVTRHGAP